MGPIKPEYLAREQKYWMRHDAHKFIRPDWRRFVKPGSETAAVFEVYEQKYRPDQARVPSGSRDGGQWVDEGGAVNPRATGQTEGPYESPLAFRLRAGQNASFNNGKIPSSAIPSERDPAGRKQLSDSASA